jgi:hypothetical protein
MRDRGSPRCLASEQRSRLGIAAPQTPSAPRRAGGATTDFFFYEFPIGSVVARSSSSPEKRTQPPAYGRCSRSKMDQTMTKSATNIQKRTMILDSYRFGRKDTKKDDQRLKPVPRCNLGYGETKNPNFLCGFFWIGQKQKRIYGDEYVDAHRVNAGL